MARRGVACRAFRSPGHAAVDRHGQYGMRSSATHLSAIAPGSAHVNPAAAGAPCGGNSTPCCAAGLQKLLASPPGPIPLPSRPPPATPLAISMLVQVCAPDADLPNGAPPSPLPSTPLLRPATLAPQLAVLPEPNAGAPQYPRSESCRRTVRRGRTGPRSSSSPCPKPRPRPCASHGPMSCFCPCVPPLPSCSPCPGSPCCITPTDVPERLRGDGFLHEPIPGTYTPSPSVCTCSAGGPSRRPNGELCLSVRRRGVLLSDPSKLVHVSKPAVWMGCGAGGRPSGESCLSTVLRGDGASSSSPQQEPDGERNEGARPGDPHAPPPQEEVSPVVWMGAGRESGESWRRASRLGELAVAPLSASGAWVQDRELGLGPPGGLAPMPGLSAVKLYIREARTPAAKELPCSCGVGVGAVRAA